MRSSITLQYTIHRSLDNIYPSILDFKKFGQLHPYMISVETLDYNDAWITYQVHEKLTLWGFIPMQPAYQVSVTEITKNKHIQYVSEVKKGLHLTIDFHFDYKENSTITVSEFLTLKGMPWVHAVFFSLLKKSHQEVFQTLQKIPAF